MITEANELVAIFVKSEKTARRNHEAELARRNARWRKSTILRSLGNQSSVANRKSSVANRKSQIVNRKSSIAIVDFNRQSQSTINNLNPQSSIDKSAIANPQPAIDLPAPRVHLEVRVAFEAANGNERRLAVHAEALFGAAVGAQRPDGRDQLRELVARGAGAQRTPQVGAARA